MLFRLLYTFVYWVTASFQFAIKEMDIPTHVALGSNARLSCKVDTRGIHQLHSVKWYKDDSEFCRFTPQDQQTVRSFFIPGLADSIHCLNDSVEMRNVSILASGSYKCEASSEAPTFRTVMNSRNISVMVYPTRDPVITGLRPSYYRGENIEAKCSSSPSNPPPKLRWFLNGIATNRFISNDIIEAVDPDGLYKRSQELHLIAHPELFTGADNRLTLMCEATLPGLPPWQVLAKVTLRSNWAGDGRRDNGKTKKSSSETSTFGPRDVMITSESDQGSGQNACGSGMCTAKNRGNDGESPVSCVIVTSIIAVFQRRIFLRPMLTIS